MMLALVASGWIIAGSARRLKGGPADAPLEATAIADPVPAVIQPVLLLGTSPCDWGMSVKTPFARRRSRNSAS